MTKNVTKQLLLSNNYWVVNKTLVKKLGIEPTLLLSIFAEAEQKLSDKDGWFYQTNKTVEDMSGLTRYKQEQAIKLLKEKEILNQDNRGVPMKRYFKIDYEVLANLFVSGSHSSMRKTDKLKCEKLATSKELSNKELIYKEKDNVSLEKTKVDDIPYEEILDYLNEKAGRSFDTKGKRSQAHRNKIKTRWNQGFTLDEFKQVIDNMVAISKTDKFWITYLQPSTLFGKNFSEYLNKEVKQEEGFDFGLKEY